MCPVIQKRGAAVKTADAINAIEGALISSYARALSTSWGTWRTNRSANETSSIGISSSNS